MNTPRLDAATVGDDQWAESWSRRCGAPAPGRGVVDRPRVRQLLERHADKKLILVSAPAGSGKTTAVASWLRQRPGARDDDVAWLTFPGIVDPAAAVSAVGHLLSTAWGHGERPILVLDGCEIAPPDVLRDLEAALLQAPRGLQVVVVTRTDETLPFASLRLADEVAEVRLADVAFTEDEVVRVLAAYRLRLEEEELTELMRHTQGWVAGVRFAALRLAETSGPGRRDGVEPRDVVRWFVKAEVVDRLSVATRQLMFDTCLPEVLEPGLVEELAGPGAGGRLRELAYERAFVEAIPGRPGHYRYHPVLLTYLRDELYRESPHRRARQQRRLTRWQAQHPIAGSASRLEPGLRVVEPVPLRARRAERYGSAPEELEPFVPALTPKEIEVLHHLSELLTTEEIAATMFVSVNTVRTHVRNILRKLAVGRRNEAVRRGRDLRLIAAS